MTSGTERAAVEEQRADITGDARRRAYSLREEASVFRSHPPTGLRHRMAGVSAYQEAKVVLTELEAERIDAELAKHYERCRRIIAESW